MSAKSRRLARNYEALYDKTGVAVLARKPQSELNQMLSTGEAIRACKRCGGTGRAPRCNGKAQDHQMVWAATDLFRNSHRSQATLTMADMLANVGIAGQPLEPPKKGRIEAAQAKIKVWPEIGDTLAIRVRPRA